MLGEKKNLQSSPQLYQSYCSLYIALCETYIILLTYATPDEFNKKLQFSLFPETELSSPHVASLCMLNHSLQGSLTLTLPLEIMVYFNLCLPFLCKGITDLLKYYSDTITFTNFNYITQ